MQRAVSIMSFGLLIGVIGVLNWAVPIGSHWEEDTGLGLLFKLRGQQPAPQEVVVIAINGNSSQQLGLSDDISSWPRSLYAQLIYRLIEAEASVIVFDIFFKKTQGIDQDKALAVATQRAGNVLLVGYLEQEALDIANAAVSKVEIERLRPPIEILANSAVAIGPFVLPKVPKKVSRFWTFHSANELASLPSAALELHVDPTGRTLRQLLKLIEPDSHYAFTDTNSGNGSISEILPLRALLRRDEQLRSKLLHALANNSLPGLDRDKQGHLRALLSLYAGNDYPYLNFYGPPGTITTIPFQQILSGKMRIQHDLKDKVVFVGYAGQYQPKQKDGFFTVFSQADGLDLSGVEIAATAFANLLKRETIEPLDISGVILILLVYGIMLIWLLHLLPGMRGIIAGMIAAAVYFLFVYYLFAWEQIWLPWFIPLSVQTPLAMVVVLIWHYREAHISRQRLRHAFGYYLPGEVVDRLAEDTGQTQALAESSFGVCLATDAQQYTRLAESMSPEALKPFLNNYYEMLFAPVRARGGTVSDVIGDAMMAIWSAPQADASTRSQACEAALEINSAISRLTCEPKLHTRIGLHAGQLVMSHVGAIDHYEYRAVGDIVNTAARIENLNKSLGTSILASQEVLEGLDQFTVRELGVFQLEGKQQLLKIFEIINRADVISIDLTDLHDRFARALVAWQGGEWQDALLKFKAILHDYPDDGPSRYYLLRCQEYENTVPQNPLGGS